MIKGFEHTLVLIVLATVTIGIVLRLSATSGGKRKTGSMSLRHRNFEREQQIENTNDRLARSISGNNCETWAPWVNDNHPNASHIEDQEYVSPKTLRDYCPDGTISKFECADTNGEPFHANVTRTNFFLSCYDLNVGVICTPLDHSGGKCPDVSIRYYCNCTIPPPSPTTPEPTTGIAHTTEQTTTLSTATEMVKTTVGITTAPPVPSASSMTSEKSATTASVSDVGRQDRETSEKETTFNLGGLVLPWWLFVLILSGILFIISTCISVCLYKKATGRLSNHYKTSVHPLDDV